MIKIRYLLKNIIEMESAAAKIDIGGLSGKHGKDGKDGVSYGEKGQNAGPAEDGGHGGSATLRIKRIPGKPHSI
jgi:hypothetical protein